MRLGGPVFGPAETPELWVEAVRRQGYRAAYCPAVLVKNPQGEGLERAFVEAAQRADIVIAEVGAWSNPISRDEEMRTKAIALCQERLALAERIGARCCVNIAGSRGEKWDGPHPENLSTETFDLIVQTARTIIDAVKPTRTAYALETMPWVFPDSPDSYLALLKAIDRKACAVHLDPVNMINCPSRYYDTGGFIRDCFAKLGPFIKTCHAKDIILQQKLTVHLDECRPGLGGLDYRAFLSELAKLDPDTPIQLEHLKLEEEYAAGAQHIRQVAAEIGVTL